jgi:hypothetical protein
MGPQFSTRLPIERVNSCLHAGGPVHVRARDDSIVKDKDVTMEEVLARIAADIRFPSHVASFRVEPTEQAITRTDEQRVTRDRGCVGESTSGCELPNRLGCLRFLRLTSSCS